MRAFPVSQLRLQALSLIRVIGFYVSSLSRLPFIFTIVSMLRRAVCRVHIVQNGHYIVPRRESEEARTGASWAFWRNPTLWALLYTIPHSSFTLAALCCFSYSFFFPERLSSSLLYTRFEFQRPAASTRMYTLFFISSFSYVLFHWRIYILYFWYFRIRKLALLSSSSLPFFEAFFPWSYLSLLFSSGFQLDLAIHAMHFLCIETINDTGVESRCMEIRDFVSIFK